MSPVAQKAAVSLVMPVLDVCLAMTIITISPGALEYMQHQRAIQSGANQPALSEADIEPLRTLYQELWRRYEQMLLLLRQKPSPDQPPIDIGQQEAAQQELNRLIKAFQEEIARLRKLLENSSSADAKAQNQIEALRRMLDQLRQKIAEAEAELKKLHYTQEQLQKNETTATGNRTTPPETPRSPEQAKGTG